MRHKWTVQHAYQPFWELPWLTWTWHLQLLRNLVFCRNVTGEIQLAIKTMTLTPSPMCFSLT